MSKTLGLVPDTAAQMEKESCYYLICSVLQCQDWVTYTLFSAAGLFAFRSQTEPTHHRPWLLCLSSLLVAEPSPSFCFSWHSFVKEKGCRPVCALSGCVLLWCQHLPPCPLFPVVIVTCLLVRTKYLTIAIYGLSFGGHFHCKHNSHVSVFIWGFTLAHSFRIQSIMDSKGRWMISPFYSVKTPAHDAPTFWLGLPASATPV